MRVDIIQHGSAGAELRLVSETENDKSLLALAFYRPGWRWNVRDESLFCDSFGQEVRVSLRNERYGYRHGSEGAD